MKAFMARMPKRLRIGPYDWTVGFITQSEQFGNGNMGICEPSQQRIRIQEKPPSTHSAVDTMLHEISHAIFTAYHLRADHDSEERIVSVFGSAWVQIYRDNPILLAWITEGVGHA